MDDEQLAWIVNAIFDALLGLPLDDAADVLDAAIESVHFLLRTHLLDLWQIDYS